MNDWNTVDELFRTTSLVQRAAAAYAAEEKAKEDEKNAECEVLAAEADAWCKGVLGISLNDTIKFEYGVKEQQPVKPAVYWKIEGVAFRAYWAEETMEIDTSTKTVNDVLRVEIYRSNGWCFIHTLADLGRHIDSGKVLVVDDSA